MQPPTNIAILGSTGSIGKNSLQVVSELDGFNLFGISGHSQVDSLVEQARSFGPEQVVFSNSQRADQIRPDSLPGISVGFGSEAVTRLAGHESVDIVVAAIMGRAGLESSWAAVESGKRLALANKETLVVAGQQIQNLAKKSAAELIPVDSEHLSLIHI